MEERHLKRKIVQGVSWVFGLKILTRLLSFARIVILARLLTPEDFGLVGIALLVLSILETFSQTGFREAIVQKEKMRKEYLDVAWSILVIRGFILSLIVYLLSPLFAGFFKNPAALPVIKVMALSLVFSGLTNVGIVFFQKELEFGKQFIYQLSGLIADLGTSITLAFILKNAWALVWGKLAGNFVLLLMSYVVHPYRPGFCLKKKEVKELFAFGKWVTGSSIALFLLNQGDDILVGRVLGTVSLGLYQMAYRLSNLPATEITHTISTVSFPAYAKVYKEKEILTKYFFTIFTHTLLFAIPLAGGIITFAPDFVKYFMGEKWYGIIASMQILAVWGGIRAIGASCGSLFLACGRPDIITKLTFFKLCVLVSIIYPLTVKLGIEGTSLAVVLTAFVSNPVTSYIAVKYFLQGKIMEYIKPIFLFTIITFISGWSAVHFKKFFSEGILGFGLSVMIYLVVYFFCIFLLKRWGILWKNRGEKT